MLIQDMSRKASIELLARTRMCRLACAHEGQPYITSMHCVYDAHYLYAFSTLGQKITWMRTNPLVCVLAEEVVSPQDWASVIVFGKYEELTDTTQCEAHRQHAFDLLQTRPVWWEPGYVKTVLDGKTRLVVSIYFRIHIDQISGHRGTPDAPGVEHAAPPRGTARWFRRILGRSEHQSGNR
jgi:uncharacterized protein